MRLHPLYKYFYSILLFIGISCGWKENAISHALPYIPPPLSPLENGERNRLSKQLAHYFGQNLLRNPTAFNGGILVAKGGIILFEKYQGFEDLPTKEQPLSAQSSLHIASTSKTFTAIALLQLVQDQKISLSDSLNKFFERWPYPGITIKDLLNHRSGLPNYVYFMTPSIISGTEQPVTNQDVIQFLINNKPPKHSPPNSRFEYSNTNYLLLACIIEKISGLPYPDYMRKALFSYLGMKNTFVYQPADSNRITPSYEYTGRQWPTDHLDLTYGDKNIYSTPRDLLKWDQALYTQQLISDSLLQAAFSPYSFERPGQNNYGLGFRLKLLSNEKKVIYHFGRWHGNNAAFARLTDEKVTIIILGNKYNRTIYATATRLYGLFGPYNNEFLGEDE